MELREKINEIIVAVQVDVGSYHNGLENAESPDIFTDQILALLPKPTVKVLCDKCGGSGRNTRKEIALHVAYGEHEIYPCPHCTDGKVDREIVWEYLKIIPIEERRNYPPAADIRQKHSRTLTLPDLADPDVRMALCELEILLPHRDINTFKQEIPNNKGALRVKESE